MQCLAGINLQLREALVALGFLRQTDIPQRLCHINLTEAQFTTLKTRVPNIRLLQMNNQNILILATRIAGNTYSDLPLTHLDATAHRMFIVPETGTPTFDAYAPVSIYNVKNFAEKRIHYDVYKHSFNTTESLTSSKINSSFYAIPVTIPVREWLVDNDTFTLQEQTRHYDTLSVSYRHINEWSQRILQPNIMAATLPATGEDRWGYRRPTTPEWRPTQGNETLVREAINAASILGSVNSLPSYSEYKKAQHVLTEKQRRITQLNDTLHQCDQNVIYYDNEIRRREREILNYNAEKVRSGVLKETTTKQIEEEKSVLVRAQEKADTLNLKLTEEKKTLYRENRFNNDYFRTNLKMEILDLVCDDHRIKHLHLRTTEPFKITVLHDGNETIAPRVSGPHECRIDFNDYGAPTFAFRAAYPDSIIGQISAYEYRCHPHVQVQSYTGLANFTYCCPGELTATVMSACTDNDLPTLLIAIKNYLCSANITHGDVWGLSYRYFPEWDAYVEKMKSIATPDRTLLDTINAIDALLKEQNATT